MHISPLSRFLAAFPVAVSTLGGQAVPPQPKLVPVAYVGSDWIEQTFDSPNGKYYVTQTRREARFNKSDDTAHLKFLATRV